YKYRPQEHNLTSEWNFLYNKAHNEFLNYMATTGTFGILSYLSITFVFFLITLSLFSSKVKKLSMPLLSRIKANNFTQAQDPLLIVALASSFVTILVTNFFGFSVVITNVYLILIPLFVFILIGIIDQNYSFHKGEGSYPRSISVPQWIGILI